MSMWKLISSLMGRNPELPFIKDVVDPVHGMEAKNHHHQKVIYDQGIGWVMPQNFSGKPPVEVKSNKD